jgi:hypothetical protein
MTTLTKRTLTRTTNGRLPSGPLIPHRGLI